MLPMVQPEAGLNCGAHSGAGATAPSASVPPPSLSPESDVDDLVVSFLDIDVAIQRIESCDLQLGDTWRGMQGKMSVTASNKKKQKNADHKPQSQLNKCHNEKRRRELENEQINQLEELLGTCLAEVKQPDKNGIVREATRQIQEVLKRRRECPSECPARLQCLPAPPLQGGEVSSTQPQPAPVPQHYSEITTLIEALKHYTSNLGWVLLEINSNGEIECVTENIKDLIYQDRTELHKRSIYSVLHANDHSKIRPLLRNIQSLGWSGGDVDKFQAVQVKFVIKTNGINAPSRYVETLIDAAAVRGSSSEAAGSVMCVIRRREDATAALLPVDGGPPAIAAKLQDHVVFRLDTNYTILNCDLSGVENCINSPLSLVGTCYLDLVESADRHIAAAHLQDTICHLTPPTSAPFRLCVSADKPWIRVSARSRLFPAQPESGEQDFIMATHSILSDDEANMLEASSNPALPALGGPLLSASAVNGESSASERYRSPISPGDSQFSINDFDLEPWSIQLGEMSEDRKDSTSSGPPTPRTPQTPGEGAPGPPGPSGPPAPVGIPGPLPPEEPNRLRILLSKPSAEVGTNNRILKDLLKQEDEEASGESAPPTPHTPLTPHTPHTPHTPAAALSPLQSRAPPVGHNNSDMLLRILNEKTDEDGDGHRRSSMEGRAPQSALLTQLLASNGPASNGRSQDADNYLERLSSGVKRKFEEGKSPAPAKRATPETHQVSSSAAPVASSSSSTSSSASPSGGGGGGGMSSLCQKNQILVSLLKKQQAAPQPPPSLQPRTFGPPRPMHHPLASHQQHPPHQQHPRHLSPLSNLLTQLPRTNTINGGPSVSTASPECTQAMHQSQQSHQSHQSHQSQQSQQSQQSHLQMVLSGGRASYPPPAPPAPSPQAPTPIHYGTTAPHHLYNNQQNNSRALAGSEVPNDQALSDILDAVIDTLSDSDRSNNDVSGLLGMENRQMRTEYTTNIREEDAVINAIRQSLMQCEKVSKSPVSSSPSAPPVYAVQSPGSCNMSGGLYSMGNASPQPQSQSAGAGGGAARGEEGARVRALGEQHRARLLQMQRSQQLLVSPEAADTPQADLGSTINALVSGTPPNVALTRTDFNHLYHPASQIGSNYGTNKITSSQQNPMLSRQLSTGGGSGGGGGGYASPGPGGAAALHTPPLSQHAPPQGPLSPFHRAQRPPLVGGYYDDRGGYCGDYTRRLPLAHPAHPSHPAHPAHVLRDPGMPCAGNGSGGPQGGGGGGGGATSEFVRNELRAVVGARSSRPDLHQQMQQDLDLLTYEMPTPGGERVSGGRGAPANAAPPWDSLASGNTMEAGSAEAAAAAAAAVVAAAAAAGGGDETRPAAQGAGAAAKASLLQKLLSQ